MVKAVLALALWLAPSLPAASPAALDRDTLDMVKAFLQIPTESLPPEHIPRFLAVDPAALPAKLRRPFRAKRLELHALKRIADGRKKGAARAPAPDCAIDQEAASGAPGILAMAGFVEISEDEERHLMQRTRCSERELMCEFTLQIAAGKKGSGRRLFLQPKDPLMALVGEYRQFGRVKQTNFFGASGPQCTAQGR